MTPDLPQVSVVIPCRDDGHVVGSVLDALRAQTYPRELTEIIVVDNGSADGAAAVARARGVTVLEEHVCSSYAARNQGIRHARGSYLLFLDADAIPAPEWIEALVRTARESGSTLVGGRIENVVCSFSLGSVLFALSHSAERRRDMQIRTRRLIGCNMLIARHLFERHGLFLVVESGGDGEFAERANPERHSVPFAHDAVVTHLSDLTTRAFLRRAFRVARGQAQTRGANTPRPPAIPWSPGPRRALAVYREIRATWPSFQPPLLLLRIAVVLWLQRWFHYAGFREGLRLATPAPPSLSAASPASYAHTSNIGSRT